ncbi:MAG: GTP cyclohydrolase FolE2 [Kordiimonas sp.]
MFDKTLLPDVAAQQAATSTLPLDWVGMEAIALPVLIPAGDVNQISVTTKADCFVNLDMPGIKGIHMSRLYLELKEALAHQILSEATLSQLLRKMVASQQGISSAARLRFSFDLPLKKPALLSNETGVQAYEVEVIATLSEGVKSIELGLTIPYSSTCPCSAALSRQLLATRLDETFSEKKIDKSALIDWIQSEQGSVATPHSQRSYAYINLTFQANHYPDIADLIRHFEAVIGTPVQTAVKREDEQAFAKLNAENLMFCEDAARKLKAALEDMPTVKDYAFKVEHQESLHAHNAVVIDRKFS